MKNKTLFITETAMIACLYIVLTLLSSAFGLDKGIMQLRLSEALTLLPCLTPAAIPALFIGCFFSGILTSALPTDIIFGSLATLIGALGTYYIGKRSRMLSAAAPIISNTLIIPFILKYAYHLEGSALIFAVFVFIGEFISAGILGNALLSAIPKKYSNK